MPRAIQTAEEAFRDVIKRGVKILELEVLFSGENEHEVNQDGWIEADVAVTQLIEHLGNTGSALDPLASGKLGSRADGQLTELTVVTHRRLLDRIFETGELDPFLTSSYS